MTKYLRLMGAILLLWLPFSLAALVSIPRLLWALITNNERVWKPVGRAMDKLTATLFRYSGNYTLSAELGKAPNDYPKLRKFLDLFEKDHCLKAAKSEGLIDKLI